jgi:hypothetical protein
MREIIELERKDGREVRDVSANNIGYDLESIGPEQDLCLIEVKGRDHRGGTVTLTRNELLVAKNKRASYVLAIVEIDGEAVRAVHMISDPLGRETDDGIRFGEVAATFDIAALTQGTTVTG